MGVVGEFNNNLKELEKLTKTNIYSRGNSILVKSTPKNNEIVKEVKRRQLIFPFVSEVLRGGDLLSEISKNFKYIIVMRNPIDLVFTWFRSGRGTRLGIDQRYLKPALQFKEFDNLHLYYIYQ